MMPCRCPRQEDGVMRSSGFTSSLPSEHGAYQGAGIEEATGIR
jgi:hypothetical protein